MHPGFFEKPRISMMPEEEVFDEMLPDVSFGYYDGAIEALKENVAQVDNGWPRYFNAGSRVYCGFVEDEVVSFCIIGDYGTFDLDGRRVSIGGPRWSAVPRRS